MLVVFPVSFREVELATKLARWIETLGGVKNHECLVEVARNAVGSEKPIVEALSHAFGKVSTFSPCGEDESGWPNSANFMWRSAVQEIGWNRGDVPFLWIEPDSVPLKSDWMDQFEAEYNLQKKHFLGARVQIENIPVHMSGIAIYWKTMRLIPGYAVVQFMQGYSGPQVAWDVQLAPEIMPRAHFTKLIQHEWRPDPFLTPQSLSRLNPESVIYHQVKDGSLIDRLMEERVNFVPSSPSPVERSVSNGDFEWRNKEEEKGSFYKFESYPSNTIFAFFNPCQGIDENEQRQLISLWEYSWRKAGWNPVVLDGRNGLDDLEENLSDSFLLKPSINPLGYDLACFLRWTDISRNGGGFMCDYDCMNNGLSPMDVPERLTVYQTNNTCPSLVGGSGEEFLRMAKLFASSDFVTTENGRPHTSDMHMLQNMNGEFDEVDLVSPYGKEGWEKAKVIHFANQTMNGKKPRSEWIPKLMSSIGKTEPVSTKHPKEQITELTEQLGKLVYKKPPWISHARKELKRNLVIQRR